MTKQNNLGNTSSIKKVTPTSNKKGTNKVTIAIIILGAILIGLIGTQLAINPPSSNKTYSYFKDLDNTFSAKFLEKLNSYRDTNGLSSLNRVDQVSNGSSVTYTLPNLSSFANKKGDNTEEKLAQDILENFLNTPQNKEIATATVSNIYLNTEVKNNTLTMVVKVPYES